MTRGEASNFPAVEDGTVEDGASVDSKCEDGTVEFSPPEYNFAKRVDGTAESHDTHISHYYGRYARTRHCTCKNAENLISIIALCLT